MCAAWYCVEARLIFAFDDFELDAQTPERKPKDLAIKADTQVLRLLAALVRQAGQLVTKQDLVAEVWDDSGAVTTSPARSR